MVSIYRKSKNDLYLSLQNRLQEIGIAYTSVDSIANILNEFITDEISFLADEFNAKLSDLDLSSASGNALDEIAYNMYGLTRKQSKAASAANNLKFTNSSETETITIPEGVLISAGSRFSDSGVVYETTEEITLQPNSEVYVNIIATEAGSSFNVESNTLVNHNFSNVNISCLNEFAILNGRDTENDNDFRNRALRYLNALTSNNLEFLNLSLLDVPGVTNVRLVQGYAGLGTMSAFVLGQGNSVNAEVLRVARNRAEEIASPGERIFIEEGESVVVDIDLRLINNNAYSTSEIDNLKFEIKKLISAEFLNAKTSGQINFDTLDRLIKDRLSNNFNFVPTNADSIFRSITYSVSDRLGNATTTKQFNYSSLNRALALKVQQVPVVGTINIEVELVL